jgi:hypothetical protein
VPVLWCDTAAVRVPGLSSVCDGRREDRGVTVVMKLTPLVFNPHGKRQKVNIRDALLLCESPHTFACRRANEAKKRKKGQGAGAASGKKKKKGGRKG